MKPLVGITTYVVPATHVSVTSVTNGVVQAGAAPGLQVNSPFVFQNVTAPPGLTAPVDITAGETYYVKSLTTNGDGSVSFAFAVCSVTLISTPSVMGRAIKNRTATPWRLPIHFASGADAPRCLATCPTTANRSPS